MPGSLLLVSAIGGESAEHGFVVHPTGLGEMLVTVTGEHDLACRDGDRRLLLGLVARHDVVVVDVSHAEFVDVGFATTLLLAAESARSRGKELRLRMGTAPEVRLVLEASGVLEALPCEEA